MENPKAIFAYRETAKELKLHFVNIYLKEDATARTRANFEPQGDILEDHAELRSESLQASSVVLLCPYCLKKHTRQLLQPVWSTLVPHDAFPEREASHCGSRGTEARFLQRHSYGSDTAAIAILP